MPGTIRPAGYLDRRATVRRVACSRGKAGGFCRSGIENRSRSWTRSRRPSEDCNATKPWGDAKMQRSDDPEYDDAMVEALELVWGPGFLSPGGPDEVARVIAGLDLKGRSILDIGCGVGGIDFLLAEVHGAGRVVGVDVEAANIERAKSEAERRGLAGRVAFVTVAPGPLPFPDGSFDIVFSKDAIIHIPDKEALFRDVFRLLVPGGWFAASDWLRGDDAPPSAEMRDYIEAEGLSFAMASPRRYREAMAAAGFERIA